MRKILLFTSLIGMLLQAQECDSDVVGGRLSVGDKLPSGEVVSERVERYIKAKPLEFDGHQYVAFLYYNGTRDGFSVVHSASCPCMDAKEEGKESSSYSIW